MRLALMFALSLFIPGCHTASDGNAENSLSIYGPGSSFGELVCTVRYIDAIDRKYLGQKYWINDSLDALETKFRALDFFHELHLVEFRMYLGTDYMLQISRSANDNSPSRFEMLRNELGQDGDRIVKVCPVIDSEETLISVLRSFYLQDGQFETLVEWMPIDN